MERRETSRKTRQAIEWFTTAKLRPGGEVTVIDLSNGGVLVESNARLLPGTRVEVHFLGPEGRVLVAARVIRCQVAALPPSGVVRYRGALAFDRPLVVPLKGDNAEYDVPRRTVAHPSGGENRLPLADRAAGGSRT